MAQKIIELKRCPFCGGEGSKMTFDGKGFLVICTECAAETSVYDTGYDAIVAWNKRIGEEYTDGSL